MAQITGVSLSHAISGNDVLFTINATIRFQPHELNTHWGFFMTFMESDTWPNPDDRLRNTFGRTIFAGQLTQSHTFNESLSKSRVNTEWGDEAVYVNVTVAPLEAPPPFISDSARTNKTNVDV
jgi:hypothetical protein